MTLVAPAHAEVTQHPGEGKPIVRSISPRTGGTAGGTAVAIKGRHLAGVTSVRFGDSAPLPIASSGRRKLTVLAPPHAPGPVKVKVVWRGGRSATQTFTYRDRAGPPVAPPPHVTKLVPAIGSYGDQVLVSGDGFSAASTVTFGGENATVLQVSPTEMSVQVPLHDFGPAQVQVTSPKGRSAPSEASVFTYRPWCTQIEVAYVIPSRGVLTGGTRVDLWGGPFDDVRSVTFDGVPGTDVVVPERGHLQVTTPAHALGTADVQVNTRCGQSPGDDEDAQFRFTPPPPTLTSISPNQSSLAGTRVTITGTNFEEVERVYFFGEDGTDLVVVSPTELQVTVPPLSGGATAHVAVVTSGGWSPASAGDSFTWVAPPSVGAAYPPHSAVTGGSRVLVQGQGFTGLGGVTGVDFGGAAGTDVVVDSDTELHVTAPPHVDGLVHVRVTTPAGTSETGWINRFSYDPPDPPAGATAVPAPLPGGSTASSSIRDVACPAPGECFAVGSYDVPGDESRPLVERLSLGTWTPTALPLPPDAVLDSDWSQDARMQRVACTAADFCAAAGVYDTKDANGTPTFAVWDGTVWTVSTVDIPEAVNGDDWITFAGLDCTADRRCAAVGADLVFAYEGGTWAIAPTPDLGTSHGRLTDVDCTATECFAVGTVIDEDFGAHPLVERGVGLAWTAQQLPQPADAAHHGGLNAIACSTDVACTAVGSYRSRDDDEKPLVETFLAGTWTPSSAPQPSVALPDVYSFFRDVSCAAPDSCVAVGAYEDVAQEGYNTSYPMLPMVTFLGPGPARTEPVPMPGADLVYPRASMSRVVCAGPGECVGTGGFEMLLGRARGLVGTFTDGQVQGAAIRTPFQDRESSLAAIATDSATTAVAVGRYNDEQGYAHGLLVTGVAVGS